MKTALLFFTLFFLFLLPCDELQGQVNVYAVYTDHKPSYRKWQDEYILKKIEYKEDRMVIYFQFVCKSGKYTNAIFYPPGDDNTWYLKTSIDSVNFPLKELKNIRRNGELMKSIVDTSSYSISALGNYRYTIFNCEAYFERPPLDLKTIDLIEGKGQEYNKNHFNCFRIKLKPSNDKDLGTEKDSEDKMNEFSERFDLEIKADKAAEKRKAEDFDEYIDKIRERMVEGSGGKYTDEEAKRKVQEEERRKLKIELNKKAKIEYNKSLAELNRLKNNPDILWIGEGFVDCIFDYNYYIDKKEAKQLSEIGFVGVNYFKTVKHQVYDIDKFIDDDHNFISKIYNNIKDLEFYVDDNLRERYTVKEANSIGTVIDTMITFDPETFEEIVQVVVSGFNPKDIRFFRVKQLLYYSKKEMMFKTKVLALAPMCISYDQNGAFSSMEPMYWLKPNTLSELTELNNTGFTWIHRLYRDISLSSFKVIKGNKDYSVVIIQMIKDLRVNKKNAYVGKTSVLGGEVKMSKEKIKTLGTSVDTIITFDSQTFAEIKRVKITDLFAEDAKSEGLFLIQDWIWDEKTKAIKFVYVGFGPIINTNGDRKFENKLPFFIRRVGWDGKR